MSSAKQAIALAAPANVAPQNASNYDVMLASAAQIVSAYIVNRPHEEFNLAALTAEVYATLSVLSRGEAAKASVGINTRLAGTPKVAIEESIKPDFIICLEDGKRVKMLKRYLRTNFNMSPEEYRNRWNLPESYPMVAPNYAKVRSQLAKKSGLGTRTGPMEKRTGTR
jgi:predicted transcriptional regulator